MLMSLSFFLIFMAFVCATLAAFEVIIRRVSLLALAIALWLLGAYVLPGIHH